MSAALGEARVETSAPLVAVSELQKRFGEQAVVAGLGFHLRPARRWALSAPMAAARPPRSGCWRA